MRASISAALAGLALAGLGLAAHADPTGEGLARAAATCINGNASKVVAQSQGLEDAVNFLVDGLCAADIRHFEAYDRNARLVALVRPGAAAPAGAANPAGGAAKALAQLAVVNIDPETGDLAAPPGAKSSMSVPVSIMSWFGGSYGATAAQARFRTLAAQAVLAAREASARR